MTAPRPEILRFLECTEAMRSWLGIVAMCTALMGALAACAPRVSPTPADAVFDGERARAAVADQVALGPRVPGTDAHERAGDYILANLQAAGLETETQVFTDQGISLRNLVGRAGAAHGPLVILGAHYDTRPVADRDPTDPSVPTPGANDGASGVAVLLELARVLPVDSFGFRLWLVFFDAEDGGGLPGGEWIVGSRAFAASLGERPGAVIVVDMVGDADLQLPHEARSDEALSTAIWETAARLGSPAFVAQPGSSILDDHVPFLELGIPAVDIIDIDYPYWHTREDTLDKVSAESLAQVGWTLQTWLTELDPASLE